MMYLRACLRCHGDVFLDRDKYGAFFKCLQCGFSRDLPAADKPRQSTSARVDAGSALARPGLRQEAA